MTYMKFEVKYGIHRATNCPVDLLILTIVDRTPGKDDRRTYVVSTAKTHDEFKTFEDAVRFAEHKFGVIMEMGSA